MNATDLDAINATVTVTVTDLASLLNAEWSNLPGTRIGVAPVLRYSLTDGLVSTAAGEEDGYAVIIDKAQLIGELRTRNLTEAADLLTEAAHLGQFA